MTRVTERLNPFPGLRAFEFGEEHLFFGREDRIDELLDRLHKHRFVAVVGSAGSGKSSLVRAGLLPALYSGFLPNMNSNWRVADVRPGGSPIHCLAAALAGSLIAQQGGQEETSGNLLQERMLGLESTLRRGRLGLVEAVRQCQLSTHENLIVVVDGLEAWIDCDAWSDSSQLGGERSEDETAAFVKLLLTAIEQGQQPIYVVMTLRSDFVGDCARFDGLPEVINSSQYLLPRLTREQLRSAIEGPIGVVGGRIAPHLVQRMLNDMGDSLEALPVMQHGLMRTWDYWLGHHDSNEPVDLRHYEAVGGLAAALTNHADRIYAQLTSQQQAIAQRMFQLLTQHRSDGRDMSRAATLQDIARVAQVSQDEVRGVVNRFRGRHNSFLMPPQPDPLLSSTVLSISHSSLMRVWPRLKEWIWQEEEAAREYKHLVELASRYWSGEAKLLQDPDLTVALRWQHQWKPNSAWASRYDSSYGDTIHFLELSRKARERESALRKSAAAAREDLRKRRFGQVVGTATAMAAIAVAALLGIVLTGFHLSNVNRARQQATNAEIDARLSASKSFQQAGQELAGAVEALTAGRQLQDSSDDPEPYLAMRVAAQLRETVDGGGEFSRLEAQSGPIYSASFSPDGQTLVSTGEDAEIVVWSFGGEALSTLHGREELSSSVSFHPDGMAIAAASADGTIDIWNLHGEVLATFQGHEGAIRDVSFSPDGKLLASAGDDATVRVWHLDGDSLVTLRGHEGVVKGIAFNPNGNTIASAGADSTVRLWNLEGKELAVLQGHNAAINALSFSPDGRTLASASADGTIKVWTVDGEEIAVLQGHDGAVNGVRFAPDGQTVASTGTDGTVMLWHAPDGMHIATLRGHEGTVFSANFSPDGHLLASAGEDGTVRVWNFEVEDLLARGCEQIAADLEAFSGTDLGRQAVCDSELIATRSSNGAVENKMAADGNSNSRSEPNELSASTNTDFVESEPSDSERIESDSESQLDGEGATATEPVDAESSEEDSGEPEAIATAPAADEEELSEPSSSDGESSQLDNSSQAIAAAEADTVQPATTPSIPQGRVTWPDGLRLLSAPAGSNVGGIRFNEIVEILDTSGDGQWQRVRRESNGQEGWVKAGNLALLPAVEEPDAPESVATGGDSTADSSEHVDSGETASSGETTHSSENADSGEVVAASSPAGDRGRVTWPSGLAIRPVPQDGVRQIDGIRFNEVVTILENSEDGRWQRVRRDATGTEGWVKAGNIAALTTSPNSPAASTPSTSASYRGRVTWRRGLAIRVEPRDGAAQIDGIPFSEVVTILSTSSDGRWRRVRRDSTGTEGWVKAGNIAPIR
ncbi:MAG: SH3 domain-containing protein [Synechococcus sp.]